MAAQQQISKGLATWAGLVAAAGQYAGAVAVFLNDPDKATALGPLTTATVTLVAVIYGRMSQAKEAVKQAAPPPAPSVNVTLDGREIASATRQGAVLTPIDVSRRAPDVGAGDQGDDEEPGDDDALPDYGTTTVVPPDEGDRPPEAMS
jgi:hypothetical protein